MAKRDGVAGGVVYDIGIQELADQTEQGVNTIRDHVKKGCPCLKQRGTKPTLFNLELYENWRRERNLTGRRGRPPEVETTDLAAAKLRKENALADKYELQAEQARGRLIDMDEHLRIVRSLANTAKNKLLSLPASVSPRLVGLDGGEIQSSLEDEVTHICDELCDEDRYESLKVD